MRRKLLTFFEGIRLSDYVELIMTLMWIFFFSFFYRRFFLGLFSNSLVRKRTLGSLGNLSGSILVINLYFYSACLSGQLSCCYDLTSLNYLGLLG